MRLYEPLSQPFRVFMLLLLVNSNMQFLSIAICHLWCKKYHFTHMRLTLLCSCTPRLYYNMRLTLLCLQQFHNKFYVVGCYLLLLVGKKVISVLDLNLKPITTCQLGFVVKILWKCCGCSSWFGLNSHCLLVVWKVSLYPLEIHSV